MKFVIVVDSSNTSLRDNEIRSVSGAFQNPIRSKQPNAHSSAFCSSCLTVDKTLKAAAGSQTTLVAIKVTDLPCCHSAHSSSFEFNDASKFL